MYKYLLLLIYIFVFRTNRTTYLFKKIRTKQRIPCCTLRYNKVYACNKLFVLKY
ncbi:hypothetical protein [Staphylococcus phage vB_SauM-V1SA20]|nr:hypothetical protein [Staphylococcus phage vB_SauM-V1SA20]